MSITISDDEVRFTLLWDDERTQDGKGGLEVTTAEDDAVLIPLSQEELRFLLETVGGFRPSGRTQRVENMPPLVDESDGGR